MRLCAPRALLSLACLATCLPGQRALGVSNGSSLHELLALAEAASNGTSLYALDEGALADWRSLAGRKREGAEREHAAVRALLIFSYSVIIIVSLFGNVLVCHVVMKNKRSRSATSLFIANLAVADIFITLLNTPFTLVHTHTHILYHVYITIYLYIKSSKS